MQLHIILANYYFLYAIIYNFTYISIFICYYI